MTEKNLQYECVKWFGEQFPELQNLLIEINNDTYSRNQSMRRRAMGMRAGAGDLLFFYKKNLIFIELKNTETRHKRQHILQQFEFGESIRKQGGYHFFVNNLIQFQNIIEMTMKHPEYLDLAQKRNKKMIENLLNNGKKTIVFRQLL